MNAIDNPNLYVLDDDEVKSAYEQLRPAEQIFVDRYVSKLAAERKEIARGAPAFSTLVEMRHSGRDGDMLKRPMVRAAIAERHRALLDSFNVSTKSVVAEIASIALSNMANYMRVIGGEPVIDLSNCTVAQMAAISELTVEDFKDGRGDDARDVRRIKIKLHPKINALDMLMKYLNAYAPDKLEISGPSGAPIAISDAASISDAAEIYRRQLNAI